MLIGEIQTERLYLIPSAGSRLTLKVFAYSGTDKPIELSAWVKTGWNWRYRWPTRLRPDQAGRLAEHLRTAASLPSLDESGPRRQVVGRIEGGVRRGPITVSLVRRHPGSVGFSMADRLAFGAYTFLFKAENARLVAEWIDYGVQAAADANAERP
ncbi:MAG: hypothetical protein AAF467_10025 [Actinomycetota bacterium]